MRIAVLWRPMQPGHTAAFQALSKIPETSLFFCLPKPAGLFAADLGHYDWMDAPYFYDWFPKPPGRLRQYLSSAGLDETLLAQRLTAFGPDLLLANSWHVPAYRRVMRRFRGRPRVMRIDNQWTGSPRQRIGALVADRYLHRLFDAVLVDGARQADFSRHMGYRDEQIWNCGHSADHAAFAAVYHAAKQNRQRHGEAFLYVGRLVPEKGILDLLQAYRRYRAENDRPWPLIVCGRGPLADRAEEEPGVRYRGFVQPRDLPAIYAQACCLVLPSHAERWGDAIHEATAAGLSVITTDRAGASDDLLEHGGNGFLIKPGDIDALADRLHQIAGLDPSARQAMSDRSFALSQRFTPESWASAFHQRAADLLKDWPHAG